MVQSMATVTVSGYGQGLTAGNTARKEYEGAGIGLAMGKEIVERHGGRMWVESESGKGATFHFATPDGGGSTS